MWRKKGGVSLTRFLYLLTFYQMATLANFSLPRPPSWPPGHLEPFWPSAACCKRPAPRLRGHTSVLPVSIQLGRFDGVFFGQAPRLLAAFAARIFPLGDDVQLVLGSAQCPLGNAVGVGGFLDFGFQNRAAAENVHEEFLALSRVVGGLAAGSGLHRLHRRDIHIAVVEDNVGRPDRFTGLPVDADFAGAEAERQGLIFALDRDVVLGPAPAICARSRRRRSRHRRDVPPRQRRDCLKSAASRW